MRAGVFSLESLSRELRDETSVRPRRPQFEVEDIPELYIETPSELQELVNHLAAAPRIGIDTEFVRDRQYTPVLEVVQIATDDVLAIVDYRRLRNISPLLELLHTEAILKVIHAGQQDVEIFYGFTQQVPKPLFDTQVAASVLGIGPQVGYANMVDQLLGVTLDQKQTLTNWSQRPLTGQQMSYAFDDVRYLLPLHTELRQRLDATDRLAWFIDEMAKHTDVVRFARPDPYDVWRKISGISRMPAQQLAVLREVAAWREQVARRHNRALPFIASDSALKRLARQQPRSVAELRRIRDLRSWSIERYADEILAAIARGRKVPQNELPAYERGARPLTEEEAALVEVLETWVRMRADEENLDRELLASREDLRTLVVANGDVDSKNVNVLNGWRRELIGEELQSLVAGDAGLVWNPQRGRLEFSRL